MSPSQHSDGNGGKPAKTPQDIMKDVALLLRDLTSPEQQVNFNAPPRSDSGTIQNTIFPPAATWHWDNLASRDNQASQLSQDDVGTYGIVENNHTLYKLVSVSPSVQWQAVQTFTDATWQWAGVAERLQEKVTPADVEKIGYQQDIDTYYKLTSADPVIWQQVPNPTAPSSPLELSTGASDAVSYHDFYRLQIAFEDIWAEMMDTRIQTVAGQIYGQWNEIMSFSGDYKGLGEAVAPGDITGLEDLTTFITNLKFVLGISDDSAGPTDLSPEIVQLKNAVLNLTYGSDMLLGTINWAGGKGGWKDDSLFLTQTAAENVGNSGNNSVSGNDLAEINNVYPGVQRGQVFQKIRDDLNSISVPQSSTPPDVTFQQLTDLINELDQMLREPYRFDVFAPNSINYGLLLNYRQRWQPQSYQVGNLVSSIPLAPQETRRYTTKSVVKKTRSVKEIEDSLRSGKDESSDTFREDREIVDRAKSNTSFQQNAQGSYGNDTGMYKISAAVQQQTDQAMESTQTKRDFHEAVVKSAREYRAEHRTEVSTEEVREDESTSYREVRNPNDELTVTYLFYELQRRYLVDESLYKVMPVILVANEVPAPHEIDEGWVLRHDWIIKRAILDDSFLPALEYLSSNYTGEQIKLKVLWMAVEQQKGVVDQIAQQVQLAKQAVDAATLGLAGAQDMDVAGLKSAEAQKLVKSFFDPLNISQAGAGGDGNSDRARIDFAKDALTRAQAKADQLTSDLTSQTTALQVAIDKYTAAETKHFSMLADIDRLRIHVKDNIIHYMQAIWSYEPPDQRYFRLYNLEIPVFEHHSTASTQPMEEIQPAGLHQLDLSSEQIKIQLPIPDLSKEPNKLHQVADLDNLLGFKGNYMIFPMTRFNYMNWYMMQEYIDIDAKTGVVTAQEPDPDSSVTGTDLVNAMAAITANGDKFANDQELFQEIVIRLLNNQGPEMVIVPSNSLYIEALPGTHPLLEDFKLIHRAIDIKKAQAEARHAELENLRLAARLANAEYGDPDVEKKIVIENDGKNNVTVEAGG
jgi:hypothetical protein